MALLLAPVRAGQVGGDAVQPRPGAVPAQVVPVALGKRYDKDLRRQIVGGLSPDPPGQIPVDLAEVALEDRGEPLRLGQRLPDHRRIGLRLAGQSGGHGQWSHPSRAFVTLSFARSALSLHARNGSPAARSATGDPFRLVTLSRGALALTV